MLRPIAEHADAANTQHDEVPQSFFAQVLGPNRKYSSCFYKTILELGCGSGSLSLWMAWQFPYAKVTAVSAT